MLHLYNVDARTAVKCYILRLSHGVGTIAVDMRGVINQQSQQQASRGSHNEVLNLSLRKVLKMAEPHAYERHF
jgi:hypothetical protein